MKKLIVGVLLVGCSGADGADGTDGETITPLFQTSAATQEECPNGGTHVEVGADENGNGRLAEGEVSDTFTICNGEPGKTGAEGPTGEAGPTGEQGEKGDTGQRGADVGVSSTLFCGGPLEGVGYSFVYRAAVLRTGDVWAYGAIVASDFQAGASVLYSVEQVGAATAAVVFTADIEGLDNGGYWQIEANRLTSAATIVYHDADLPGGQSSWVTNPAICVVNNY